MITGFNKACDDETVWWREGDTLSVRERELEVGKGERDWEAGYESYSHENFSAYLPKFSLDCGTGIQFFIDRFI